MNQDLMTAVYDFISNLEDSDLPANQSVTIQCGRYSVSVAIAPDPVPVKSAPTRKKAVKATPPVEPKDEPPTTVKEGPAPSEPDPEKKPANIDKDQMLDEMRLYLEEGGKDARTKLKGYIFELGAKNTDMLKKSDYPKVVAFCKGEKS